MSYPLFRNLLFLCPPEVAHRLALMGIGAAEKLKLTPALFSGTPGRPVRVMGLEFPNPVGLAAGLDKNGDYIDGLGALGFGFIEVGTVTPRPQPGNPRPRLFRLPQQRAIINRMGFNNRGVDHLVKQAQRRRYRGILGINIGKNIDTPVENALDDYLLGLRKVYAAADYVTVNISSPNTPGLRNLQFGDSLKQLLSGLKEAQHHLTQEYGCYKPLAIKIAPDMDERETTLVARTLLEYQVDAAIASNTTLSRDGVEGLRHAQEQGGLSGAPLAERSIRVVRLLCAELGEQVPVIAAGGVMDASSAVAKLQAGARLLQLYTGFIYAGPRLIQDIINAVPANIGSGDGR